MLPDFFLFCFHVFIMLLFGVPHAHPKYWHVNNVPTAIIHRVKKNATFCYLAHIVQFFARQPALLTFQYVQRTFLILFACYCYLSALLFSIQLFVLSLLLIFFYLFSEFFSRGGFCCCFFWYCVLRFVICSNACFSAVISCFITDKILHITLTNNMPLRCRCSSKHNRPQNWTPDIKS